MAQYPDSYILAKDIDWFFKMNSQYIHVASAGGKLPAIINDREKLRQIQYQVFNLPYIYSVEEILINEPFIRQLLSPQINERPELYDSYIESFVDFSRKGFISYDRTEVTDNFSNLYHIVCRPSSLNKDIHIDNIPIINNIDFEFDINQHGVNLLEIFE